MKRGMPVRLIDRLLKQKHAVSLDTLDELSKATGFPAWALLFDGFDPASPPEQMISEEERVMLRRLRRLLGHD